MPDRIFYARSRLAVANGVAYDTGMNIAMALTSLRVALIPVFVLVYYLPFDWSHLAAACLFGIAAITDWLDGFLARKLHVATRLGEFLDPVADKLLVVIALVLIAAHIHTFYMTIAVCVIISRELVVSSLREWLAESGKSAGLKVTMVAKLKTAIQMLALCLLLLYKSGGSHPELLLIGTVALYLAVGLTLWSAAEYLKIAMPDLTLSSKS